MDRVLLQISMFTCISGIEFFIDEQEERTNAIINRIYAAAQDNASILLYPDMSLYTPKGELLLSMEGNSDLESFHPIAYQDILLKQSSFDEVDQKRYQKITTELKNKGFPSISSIMSTQMTKSNLQIPTKEHIVKRVIAIFACAVCAEGNVDGRQQSKYWTKRISGD